MSPAYGGLGSRTAKQMGRARSLARQQTPTGQPNALADGIRLFGTVWAVKQPDTGMSIPDVSRYLYLQRAKSGASIRISPTYVANATGHRRK